jgi:cyclophilin family peptidyl-prolyl cis-trans isomerase
MSEHLVELHIANHGTITLELNAEKAPKTVANFLEYVKEGHYDGTIFHRVIDGFMIQGGGFDAKMKEKDRLKVIDDWETGKKLPEHVQAVKDAMDAERDLEMRMAVRY